jgi:hypothetical protein
VRWSGTVRNGAKFAQTFGEAVSADGAAGLSAGEQPGRAACVADGRVARRVAARRRTRPASGSGRTTGSRPSRSRTSSSLRTWSRVSWLVAAGHWRRAGPAGRRGRSSGLTVSSSSHRAWLRRVSVSIIPDGPVHLTAAKSSRVSFCLATQRTKFPASVRCVAWALVPTRESGPTLSSAQPSCRTPSGWDHTVGPARPAPRVCGVTSQRRRSGFQVRSATSSIASGSAKATTSTTRSANVSG